MRHRWKSSVLVALVVAAITGTLTYFSVNNAGFQKEIGRNARDIGSNVVILPAAVDQFAYQSEGGFSEVTMPELLVEQLIQYKASLNHLIPMLERQADLAQGDQSVRARVVGISASIPMPGRPKAPMQRSVPPDAVQLGSRLAEKLGVERSQSEKATVLIEGQPFKVSRVNRASGTWQDSAALMDLVAAQALFGLPGQISRIEAIECTSEQCEETGLESDVVLSNELARVTDQAVLLRREQMAVARSRIRALSRDNFRLLQSVLWSLMAATIFGLASLNSIQRKSEIGVLQAVGYRPSRIVTMFLLRAGILAAVGALLGIACGSLMALVQSGALFSQTGGKLKLNWSELQMIGWVAILLAALASCLPAMFAAMKSPSDLIGKDA